jgi:lantibiotic modifying enzyme
MTPTQRRPWRPLLDGELAKRAKSAVHDIAEALRTPVSEPSLTDGAGSRALFFGYLADAHPEGPFGDVAQAYLDQSIEMLSEVPMREHLYGGFTGIAWLAEHLQGRFLEPDDEDPNESLDASLRDFLSTTPWPGDFDLIIGLAGMGVYGLERVGRAIGRECLSLVIDRLHDEAVPRDGGLTWLSKPELMIPETRANYPNGYYNLGVAHGAPAVALVLAGACQAGVNVERARPLLDGVMKFILANRLDASSPSVMPYWVFDGRKSDPSRAAWCYGDPGAAATLLATARAVGSAEWEAAALEMGRRAAARPMDECGALDPGVCHGAAGLALLYNRLWQATGEELFADAARRWYERTLEMRKPGVGVAGFQAYLPKPGAEFTEKMWADDDTFLTGANGIGLALLAGVSALEPAWDRLLAASLPPA